MGGPEAQWKAQYLIFQKLREEGFSTGGEDIRLTVEILVPSAQVRVLYSLNFGILIEAKIPGWPNYWQGRHQCPRDAENYRGCDKTSRAGEERRKKSTILLLPNICIGNIYRGGDQCAHSRFFLLYPGIYPLVIKVEQIHYIVFSFQSAQRRLRAMVQHPSGLPAASMPPGLPLLPNGGSGPEAGPAQQQPLTSA